MSKPRTLRVTEALFSLVNISLPSQEIAGFPEYKVSLPFSNNFAPGCYIVPLNSVTIAI
jgi:hypothetical protein